MFWTLSERDILAVLEAHHEVEERWRVLAGTVAATIRNVQRSKSNDKWWTWEDFFQRVKKYLPDWKSADELDRKLLSFDAYGRAKRKRNNAKSR